MLQNDLEAELLAEANRSHDVVGAMAMEVDGALFLQDLHERIEIDVALRRRRLFAGGLRFVEAVPLAFVRLSFRQHLALQGGDLHARVRGLSLGPVNALGVLAVGELDASQNSPGDDAHGFDDGSFQADVEGLPADGIAGAGHDIGDGDAAGEGHANARIVRVNGVDSAQAGLNRAGHLVAVGAAGIASEDADVRVRIDQARDDDLA